MAGGEEKQSGISRRQLCAVACGGVLALGATGLKVLPAQALVRPPGGQDDERLLGRCIRCGRCVLSCPWHLLRAGTPNEGLLGVGLPVADFNRDWCDRCSSAGGEPLCVAACPTGALELPQNGEPLVLGKAEINPRLVLAVGNRGAVQALLQGMPARVPSHYARQAGKAVGRP